MLNKHTMELSRYTQLHLTDKLLHNNNNKTFHFDNSMKFVALGQKCDPVDFGEGSIVCKCNSTYCDFYPDPEPPIQGKYVWYVTSKAGKRLERNDGEISSTPGNNHIKIEIDVMSKYQKIEGFGGSFTDAAGINIKNLSSSAQLNLIRCELFFL